MKPFYFFMLLFSIGQTPLFAQTNEPVRCNSVEYNQLLQEQHPQLPSVEEFEKWFAPQVKAYKAAHADNKSSDLITVPIIFHIIHDNEEVGVGANLARALVDAQIEQLNHDFRKTAGTSGDNAFPQGADTEIEFCPAVVDEQGNLLAEPGINRINALDMGWSSAQYCVGVGPILVTDYIDNTVKPESIWDPNQYFNIWSLEMSCGLLGYAQFPFNSGLEGMESADNVAETDGVVLLASSIASSTMPVSGNYNEGRTATHEIGHSFGLRHIWGDGDCSADDFCDDTPNAGGSTSGCPTGQDTCTDDADPDMIENYMDYSYDACMNTFTFDQKARMQTVMQDGLCPRRWQLKYSGACTGFPSFELSINPTKVIYEGNGCGMTDFIFDVTPRFAPPGEVLVNLSITGTVDAQDYILSGATLSDNTLTFNDATPQTITLSIVQDGVAEMDETLTLIIDEVIGSGLLGAQSSHTLTIKNDDFTPATSGSIKALQTIWTEDWESGDFSADWTVTNGTVPVVGGNVWAVNTDCPDNNISSNTAKIMNEALLGLSTSCGYSSVGSDADIMRSVDATGFENLTVSFDWVCAGEAVSGTIYDYGVFEYDNNGVWEEIAQLANSANITSSTFNLPAALNGTTFDIRWRWHNDSSTENLPALSVDNIVVEGEVNVLDLYQATATIENTTDNYNEFSLGTQQTVHYYDTASGDLMASIATTDADYGCTRVAIDRAGNGATTFGSGTAEVTPKTFIVTPTNNITDQNYSITLYYTEAEVNDFLSANTDGITTAEELTMIKTAGAISSSDGTDTEVASASAVSVTRFGDDYAFTASFTSGFSGFTIGNFTTDCTDMGDDDMDGTLNCNDGCPDNKDKIAPGVCGCDTLDTDSDQDGTPNCNDLCPQNGDKIEPGVCGCDTADTDTDQDGTPDCNDLCPNDGDRIEPSECGCNPEASELADDDNDGVANCNDVCNGEDDSVDTDKDGTPDCLDVCPNNPTKSANEGVCGCDTNDEDLDRDGTIDCVQEDALAVELINLTAKAQSSVIIVSWQTTSEIGAASFIIQRSVNQRDYINVGEVAAIGTSSLINNYEWIDEKAVAGTRYYYRLEKIATDGAKAFSSVVTARLEQDNVFAVNMQPNPTSDKVFVNISTPSTTTHISILTPTGQLLKQTTIENITDNFELNLHTLPNGVYLVKISNGTQSVTQKVIKL